MVRRHSVEILAYCLMPNHVHLIAVPQSTDGLARAIGEVHRRYTRMVNFREGSRGHLWQGRFASFVVDEPYLLTAAQYIELNPVRAGLIMRPVVIVGVAPRHTAADGTTHSCMLHHCSSWCPTGADSSPGSFAKKTSNLCAPRTGRPLGDEEFVATLEHDLGRILHRLKPGPKQKRKKTGKRKKVTK